MIIVSVGSVNKLTYYSRYNRIDKYEIMDHATRIILSGATNITGSDGKIEHSGITYSFVANNLYTYKAFYIESGATYLSHQVLLKTEFNKTTIFDTIKDIVKPKNTFKVKNK